MKRYCDLDPQERAILLEKGTEPPGSAEYGKIGSEGVCLCRRCDNPLYMAMGDLGLV